MTSDTHIVGAKLALFAGDMLVVIRRDDRFDIPWPNHLDLPGGGRDEGETAADCVLRETREEIGLTLNPADLRYRRDYERPHGRVAFFAMEMQETITDKIRFGDEGQGWMLMDAVAFAAHPDAVPHFREQVNAYLTLRGVNRGSAPAPGGC